MNILFRSQPIGFVFIDRRSPRSALSISERNVCDGGKKILQPTDRPTTKRAVVGRPQRAPRACAFSAAACPGGGSNGSGGGFVVFFAHIYLPTAWRRRRRHDLCRRAPVRLSKQRNNNKAAAVVARVDTRYYSFRVLPIRVFYGPKAALWTDVSTLKPEPTPYKCIIL